MSIKKKILAGAAIIFAASSVASMAADMLPPPPPPPPPFDPPAPGPIPSSKIFPYVRLDGSLDIYKDTVVNSGGNKIETTFDEMGYNAGIGVGIALNEHIRVDATGEYRTVSGVSINCYSTDDCAGGSVEDIITTLNLTSYAGFLNAYYDITNFNGITPYVGAGLGYAYHKISDVESEGISFPLDEDSEGSFAWNVQAGASYDISRNVTLDANYRYTDLGSASATTMEQTLPDGSTIEASTFEAEDIIAHDIRLGLRYYID